MVSSDPPTVVDPRLARAGQGDQAALGELLAEQRERLRRMIALRLDRRLQGRVDASDVIQESFLEAASRLDEFLVNPSVPFYVWLRFLTVQKLAETNRHHFGAQMRSVGREVSLYRGAYPAATSAALAAHLLGHFTRPSEAAVRVENKLQLQEALNSMEAVDREVLALRHFEQLSTSETAQVLGISEEAIKKRHIRALKRLKDALAQMPGGKDLLP